MSLDINLTNVQSKPIVVSANQTAENDRVYHVIANATFTDPTGVNGKGYFVVVRFGTSVVLGGNSYTAGETIYRIFNAGTWLNIALRPSTYESLTNKKTTLTDNSDTFYPTQKAVKTAVDLKVDVVAGKGLSENDFTNTLKTKLDGIQAGAEVNVNADWNATSGDAQILNKPNIPSAVTKTSDLTNDGADGVNPFITALDIPTAGQAGTIVREVKNMTGATLTKGTVVFISGANGNKPLVSKALAVSDALSSRTFGLLQSNILNNGVGYCVVIGDLSGLNTSAFTEGAQLYLSGTVAGTYTDTKTLAPTHLVYVGKVTRSHPTQGQIEVQIQNGYELNEIHDVAISSVANNQALVYESATTLWKNKALTASDVGAVATNSAITGATKTKITYDAKGLVTAGADATTADIADSTNKRYVTDANLTLIGNTSGTNTGDETQSTILSKLGFFVSNRITESTAVTGTILETIIDNTTIPANTYLNGGIMRIYNSKFRKVGANGIFTVKMYIGPTANNLTGATQIGTFATTGGPPLYIEGLRTFTCTTSGILGLNATVALNTDTASQTSSARLSATVDWTVAQNVMFTVTLGSILDSVTMIGNSIKNF